MCNLHNMIFPFTWLLSISNCRKKHEVVFTARKRSCGKVMFLQVSVILFTGGYLVPGGVPGPRGVSAPRGAWYGGCLLLGGAWSGECLVDSPPDGYCCGRYRSYWNAFLFRLWFSAEWHMQSVVKSNKPGPRGGCLVPGGCLLLGVPGMGVPAPGGVPGLGSAWWTPPPQTATAGGRYRSYWNAFLFRLWFSAEWHMQSVVKSNKSFFF